MKTFVCAFDLSLTGKEEEDGGRRHLAASSEYLISRGGRRDGEEGNLFREEGEGESGQGGELWIEPFS